MLGTQLSGYTGHGNNGAGVYQNQANALSQTGAPPKTIASAISHVERLNERLLAIRSQVASIADAIGGPRPVSGNGLKDTPPSEGVVHRLNESVDRAHSTLDGIEDLLSSIGRALG